MAAIVALIQASASTLSIPSITGQERYSSLVWERACLGEGVSHNPQCAPLQEPEQVTGCHRQQLLHAQRPCVCPAEAAVLILLIENPPFPRLPQQQILPHIK